MSSSEEHNRLVHARVNSEDDGQSTNERSGPQARLKPKQRICNLYHVAVFVLTFMAFALVHSARKAFSNVKSSLEKEWTSFEDCPSGNASGNDFSLLCLVEPEDVWRKQVLFGSRSDAELFLGVLDTVFMFFYAVGLFISGIIGDRLPLVWVLSAGMCMASVATFLFGTVTEWTGYKERWLYGTLWAINGLAQSTCWPSAVAIMGNWFGKKGRGLVFGLWSANASVGNIIGALVVSAVLDYGYEVAFAVPAVMLFGGSVIVVFCLYASPKDAFWRPRSPRKHMKAGEPCPPERRLPSAPTLERIDTSSPKHLLADEVPDSGVVTRGVSTTPTKPIGFFAAWKIPGVLPYSLAYACLKLVTYSLFFWLPFYLTDYLKWPRTVSSRLSTLFDVGAIVGGALGGLGSDLLGYRSPVFTIMLVFATPFLFIYKRFGTGLLSNSALMLVIGFWIGGPANLLSSAISVDLGRHEKLKGNTKALSTVAGIIDGSGSLGAAIGQYFIGLIETRYGWQSVIYFLMTMLFAATLCTSHLFYKDCQELWLKYRTRR